MSFPAGLAIDPVFSLFGKAARYTPPGGGGSTDCVVIVDKRDREFAEIGRPVLEGTIIEVRASEIAAPARGGQFGPPTVSVPGRQELTRTYTIASDPLTEDPDRMVWASTVT